MKINKGDFIDSRQFSREECERFIKLAVESGYTDAEGMKYYRNTYMELDTLGVASSRKGRHVPYKHIGWGNIRESLYGFCNNITTKFREFLDKENNMKNVPNDATHYGKTSKGDICFYKLEGDTWYFLYANAAKLGLGWRDVVDNSPAHTPLTKIKRHFSKADLLDGMRVTHKDGIETIVVGNDLWVTRSENYKKHSYHINLSRYHDDLTGREGTGFSIEKVTDRDGTVVFERDQPKKKVTLELTDEQIAHVKAQFML